MNKSATLNNAGGTAVVTVGDVATMKRFTFEAQKAVIGLVRVQADPHADPTACNLPPAERTARMEMQRRRLRGLNLESPLEVGHCVYDLISGMYGADALKYIPPGKCITRLQEVTAMKPKELPLDASGQGILVKETQNEQSCSTNTELDVLEAMTRRSLAFDAIGLVDYDVFEGWVRHMFQMVRQAWPGVQAPTMTQLLRTDRQAFVRMPQ